MFDAVFHKPIMQAVDGYFQTFTAYAPRFTSWNGGIYEAELHHREERRPRFEASA